MTFLPQLDVAKVRPEAVECYELRVGALVEEVRVRGRGRVRVRVRVRARV